MITKNADGTFSEERISIEIHPSLGELQKQIDQYSLMEAKRIELLKSAENNTGIVLEAIMWYAKELDTGQLNQLKQLQNKLKEVK